MKQSSQGDDEQSLDEFSHGWTLEEGFFKESFVPVACRSFRNSPQVVNGLCITFQQMGLAAHSLT